jgi:hypothetical protein
MKILPTKIAEEPDIYERINGAVFSVRKEMGVCARRAFDLWSYGKLWRAA